MSSKEELIELLTDKLSHEQRDAIYMAIDEATNDPESIYDEHDRAIGAELMEVFDSNLVTICPSNCECE